MNDLQSTLTKLNLSPKKDQNYLTIYYYFFLFESFFSFFLFESFDLAVVIDVNCLNFFDVRLPCSSWVIFIWMYLFDCLHQVALMRINGEYTKKLLVSNIKYFKIIMNKKL